MSSETEFLERIRRDKSFNHPIKVLDIGCGKGGDLRKYRIGRVSHVVCTDIAEVSLSQCKDRYNEMKRFSNNRLFTTEFIAADSTRERLQDKYEDSNIRFDLVSVQFAFHYCFESFSQARCMLQNVADNLREGGYFITTIPDCFEIVKRLKQSESSSFGNDVYSITFDEEMCKDLNSIPLFGSQYNFHLEGVVDCPEFLVYFPLLESMASDFDLKLVYRSRFEEFFKENCDKKEGKSLLSKMTALETYPPVSGKSLTCSDDDYVHAQEFIDSLKSERTNSNEKIQIGTLSASEWEAASLYTVVAFVKKSKK
ncbi:mRNA cap guanine-N7 methyltransferase-like protein [Dinothrombium tinctorium]|uniref:mRNA (guanine-N(7))-methyltransferase n=1 Tax=Dinothrombium tinctorium TaxID=1965070 RepID=A0A3S4RG39_9ACAR|nr:mRNA cap guanine-N7 methyltransferase-like protein [Dinothrombium tinctorium]